MGISEDEGHILIGSFEVPITLSEPGQIIDESRFTAVDNLAKRALSIGTGAINGIVKWANLFGCDKSTLASTSVQQILGFSGLSYADPLSFVHFGRQFDIAGLDRSGLNSRTVTSRILCPSAVRIISGTVMIPAIIIEGIERSLKMVRFCDGLVKPGDKVLCLSQKPRTSQVFTPTGIRVLASAA
jgi:hypothetical protein